MVPVQSRFVRTEHCEACDGTACKGGGNLLCALRNPEPSVLAGILDPGGGLRCVVTQEARLAAHQRCDEVVIVVGGLTVHEPIAWNDIPIVAERIRLTVQKWIDRGLPNRTDLAEIWKMYQLRCKEQNQRSLNLEAIVET